ncbi:MAG: CheR family methyltransferase [Bacillota bacterium]
MLKQIIPTGEEVRAICEIVRTKLGLKFGDDKVPLITSRLGKRLRDLRLESYRHYLEKVMAEKEELDYMLDLLTTNVTQFFREPWQFHFLLNHVIPELRTRKKEKTIRGWSAGCATGEEPYTIAMLLLDYLPAEWSVKVLASDVSASSLQVGAEGCYKAEQMKDVPKDFLKKYFEPVDKHTYQVTGRLRQSVFFKRINLMDDQVLPSRIVLDFIFCRNVFIYFPREIQQKVIDTFFRHLAPGGYLFLGHSESLDVARDRRWKAFRGNVYQRKEG